MAETSQMLQLRTPAPDFALPDLDGTQVTRDGLTGAGTPDFFLFDGRGELAYRGAFDAGTPGNDEPVTGDDLQVAVTRVPAGEPVPEPHRPSMGCGIKWKP